MNKKTIRAIVINISTILTFCLLSIAPLRAQQAELSEETLEGLSVEFKTAQRFPCGRRDEAIRLGNLILEKYYDDRANQDFIKYVRERVKLYEKEEPPCKRDALYDESYKQANWPTFFATSKERIAAEGNSPLALDLMLTQVSVGFYRPGLNVVDSYNIDTIYYAKTALEMIESGQLPQKKWGVFDPFLSKDNAVGRLNYIVGFLSYFRMHEKTDALGYFYKAAQSGVNFGDQPYVFQAAAIYYFNQGTDVASGLTISKFLMLAKGYIDRSGEKDAKQKNYDKQKDTMVILYKKLVKLYESRYSLAPDERVNDMQDYVEKLIDRPLLETSPHPSKNGGQ